MRVDNPLESKLNMSLKEAVTIKEIIVKLRSDPTASLSKEETELFEDFAKNVDRFQTMQKQLWALLKDMD